jgi:hypothetical protein
MDSLVNVLLCYPSVPIFAVAYSEKGAHGLGFPISAQIKGALKGQARVAESVALHDPSDNLSPLWITGEGSRPNRESMDLPTVEKSIVSRQDQGAIILNVLVKKRVAELPGIGVLLVEGQFNLAHPGLEVFTVGEPDVGRYRIFHLVGYGEVA